MTDTSGTFEEPVNPALPDGGPRDGTEQSDDAPGDQVPGEHDAAAAAVEEPEYQVPSIEE